jgi:hypothetical protein
MPISRASVRAALEAAIWASSAYLVDLEAISLDSREQVVDAADLAGQAAPEAVVEAVEAAQEDSPRVGVQAEGVSRAAVPVVAGDAAEAVDVAVKVVAAAVAGSRTRQ